MKKANTAAPAKKRTIEDRISAGIKYIFDLQNEDGHWEDFLLPPGRSDMWVTAYIGLQMKNATQRMKAFCYLPQLERAAKWLEKTRSAGGGWGYNLSCPADADSTSFAILFLRAMKRNIPGECSARLRRFIGQDGGVSTYILNDPSDYWGASHPDVTPVAGMALLPDVKCCKSLLDRMKRYVVANQNENGMWNSYWWNTPLYSTCQNLLFSHETNAPVKLSFILSTLSSLTINSAFEIALLVNCRRLLYIASDEAAETLAEMQLSDGSWKSVPMLRVTYSSMAKPWLLQESGKLYRDDHHLFTTATVINSLASSLN